MPRISWKYLLKFVRWLAREVVKPEPLGMSVPGGQLSQRIRRVLGNSIVPRVSHTQLAVVTAAYLLIATVFSTGTLVRAQTKAASEPAFEVASIRPEEKASSSIARGSKSGPGGTKVGPSGGLFNLPPGDPIGSQFDYSDTLYGLITKAYELQGCGLLLPNSDCPMMAGGPDWIKKDRFVIKAKIPAGAPDYTPMQFMKGDAKQLNAMLRRLLEDSFGLKAHNDQRVIPVFALTVMPQGAKLQAAAQPERVTLSDGTALTSSDWNIGPVRNDDRALRLRARDQSWPQMALALVPMVGRPVLDRTGLTGTYDFTVDYERDPDNSDILHQLAGPALFSAFQEQLGIKVESTRAPVDILVIDSATTPLAN